MICITVNTGPDGAVAKSSANGLVGTGYAIFSVHIAV